VGADFLEALDGLGQAAEILSDHALDLVALGQEAAHAELLAELEQLGGPLVGLVPLAA
jgi:hypothetical protein